MNFQFLLLLTLLPRYKEFWEYFKTTTAFYDDDFGYQDNVMRAFTISDDIHFNFIINEYTPGVVLIFNSSNNKERIFSYNLFEKYKTEIEEIFGDTLIWERKFLDDTENAESSRISYYFTEYDFSNQSTRYELTYHLINGMIRFLIDIL